MPETATSIGDQEQDILIKFITSLTNWYYEGEFICSFRKLQTYDLNSKTDQTLADGFQDQPIMPKIFNW